MNHFELHVKSWEKSSTNFKIEIISNLSQEDIWFYVELLACFSVSAEYGKKTFGQMHRQHIVDDDNILNAVLPIVEKHKHTSLVASNFFEPDDLLEGDLILILEENMTELLSDSNYCSFRIFSDYKVYFEGREVTEQFPQTPFKLSKHKNNI